MSFFTLVPNYMPNVVRMANPVQMQSHYNLQTRLMGISFDNVSAFNSPAHQHSQLLKTPCRGKSSTTSTKPPNQRTQANYP